MHIFIFTLKKIYLQVGVHVFVVNKKNSGEITIFSVNK